MQLNYREDSHLYGGSGACGRNIGFAVTLCTVGLSLYRQVRALGTGCGDGSAAEQIG